MDLHSVCHFLAAAARQGQRTVLVTVCAVEGSSMRNPGTIMGVAQDGSFAGSLSGGCIENAVVAEALDTLAADAPRLVRFGAGSPYLDIKLPCGGGLDLSFQPLGSAEQGGTALADACLASIAAREPFAIAVGPQGASHLPGWRGPQFDPAARTAIFGHWPQPALQIVGHGAGVEALASLAQAFGCDVRVLTPDDRVFDAASARGIAAHRLKRIDETGALASDRWTATIFLFHDHDWEIDLMARAMALPHFYLGAMGGQHAHAMRVEALRGRGLDEERIAAIRAPVGLFHSSRDPHTLALSTLAEIVRTYHETDFGAADG